MEIDTDFNPVYAMEYQVRAIPSCLIFRNGEIVSDVVGAASKDLLLNQILKFDY